jgi:hypothetical protein
LRFEEVSVSKSFILGIIVGVALLIVAGVGASRLQDKNTRLKEADEKQFQVKLADATPVELGVLTEKQKLHSKLFAGYQQRRRDATISELATRAKGKGKFLQIIAYVGLEPVLSESETPEKYFGDLTQASDAVICGSVTKKNSQVTEDDGFIFTDYDVIIKEIIKNNMTAPIDKGATITITRPGGNVLIGDLVVEAIDRASEPLPNDHDVILFLQFIPESGAYKSTQDTGSFEIDGLTLRPLTQSHFPPGVLQNKDSFMQTLRTVSNQ